jgi:glucosylceramidase
MKTRFKPFKHSITTICIAIALFAGCSKSGNNDNQPQPPPDPNPIDSPTVSDVSFWLTRATQSTLLAKQNTVLAFGSKANQSPIITVDSAVTFQTMVGFGYTLTGGSAQVINGLDNTRRQSLLRELFSTDSNAISVSYLRISIGASDLSASVYTYNDIPVGQTDLNLQNFSLDPDRQHVIPILKEILAINPSIKILATPWTAPLWMKSNAHSVGGHLKPEYYAVYAQYFVKYIEAMAAEGITIDAITPQNEPLHGGNNPSMEMSAAEQTDFIKNNLGPAFEAANISTKIIIYDHNIDRPDYPIEVMNDAAAKQYIDGSAFHLYAGDISSLSMVHRAHPDKHIYFTEQYTASTGSFEGDLAWHVKNLIVGATRNWSRNVLEWNLANDPNYGPHTNGGCTTCKGALTIGQNITRNVAYYIIGHASKFVPDGSVRIMSTHLVSLPNVAFQRPDGKKVLIVLNDSNSPQQFNIKFKDKWATPTLDAGAVGTFVW